MQNIHLTEKIRIIKDKRFIFIKEFLTFGNIEIEKIGYLHNDDKVKPLHIMLPKRSTYVKNYERQTKWMYFLIKDDELLEKYNTIWDKVRANIKKQFNGGPV